jgi:hypothetical protein
MIGFTPNAEDCGCGVDRTGWALALVAKIDIAIMVAMGALIIFS